MKPMMMVQEIEQTVLLAGSYGSNQDGFSDDLDDTPVDGPSALSRDFGFKNCWDD
ncbi:hypothetical protein [Segatella copri]|uniref:hypothetical protein n=1 Tax=Segatella copri TaxID=165179 RepID=UPI003F72E237